jgi:RNA polymerase sigma factor (sigma-70 family)
VTPTHEAINTVWKGEAAKVVATLARIVRDLGIAEELAQDALVAALEEWPRSGVPDRPGAWLMTTAKNRALNTIRHARVANRKHEVVAHEIETHVPLEEIESALEDSMDRDIGDDVLRLIFTACHPVLSQEARVALTLKMVGGLTTNEIARAFLAAEPAIAQRIVRAKRTLGEARVAFELPRAEELGVSGARSTDGPLPIAVRRRHPRLQERRRELASRCRASRAQTRAWRGARAFRCGLRRPRRSRR